MRRTEHLGARALTTVGLLATLAYLTWRTAYSLDGTRLWLSLPVLLVEVVAFLGAAALAWALWPAPPVHVVSAAGPAAPAPTDVVVRVHHEAEHEVRATLLAARSMGAVAQVIVVDLGGRPSVASLAIEFGARYVATDPADGNGVRCALALVETSQFLLLDAGDIPAGDIVPRLAGDLTDDRVAVVQGLGSSAAADSPEHGPGGRHELLFERAALNPALGARGAALWLGSGSLVRTDALRSVPLGTDTSLVAAWTTGAALAAGGWRLTAPGDVAVFAHRTIHAEQDVVDDRIERARAARRLVFGSHGALRGHTLAWRHRVALLAWSVRPLSGLRRIAFVALLCAALLSGSVPFHGEALVLVCAWLPSFLYTALGLALLSGWTLRPGDRARWSLHSIGAAWQSLRSPGRPRATRTSRPGRAPVVAVPARQYGAGLVAVVGSLSTVLVLRGASDRLTHTLGELPQSVLMVLLMVTLWTLALSLDLLRVLGRRHQLRRTARVVSSLAATMGERSVSIVDLNSLGAGLLSQTGVEVHERTVLDTVIPTTSGVTSVRQPCVVRNVTLLPSGDYRIGVEFGHQEPATANALAEFCTVEPMWEHLGVMPGQSVTDLRRMMYLDEPAADASPGRTLVRVVAMFALLGVVASAAPTTVSASASLEHRVTGSVVDTGEPPLPLPAPGESIPDSLVDTDEPVPTTEPVIVESAAPEGVGGVVVVGVCSLAPGPDGQWGTADDDYDEPVATVTDAAGDYSLELTGEACWAAIDPPDGYEPADGDAVVDAGEAIAPSPVDVSGGTSNQPTIVLQRAEAIVQVPSSGGTPVGGGSDGARADAAAARLSDHLLQAAGDWSPDPKVDRAPQVLPSPAASQLAETPPNRSSLSFFVLALAALLAASLLLGLARPRSRATN